MDSTTQRTVSTTEFEKSINVRASADSIFDFLSDVSNVPKYLPTIKNAQPQQGERIRTQGQSGDKQFDSDGHFRLNVPQGAIAPCGAFSCKCGINSAATANRPAI